MLRKASSQLVSHVARKREKLFAEKSARRFGDKQSHFARKEEEKQLMQDSTSLQRTFFHAQPARAATEPTNEDLGGLLGTKLLTREDEPEPKKTRHEKFQEIISDSRNHRAEQQRERAETEQQTAAVDDEFAAVSHMLQRRDKDQEERERFASAGSAELKQLLTQHNERRNSSKGRVFSLGSGALILKTENVTSEVVDRSLLKKLCGPERATRLSPSYVSSVQNVREEDEFDKLMGKFRVDQRKAHAVDRILTEEEEAQQFEEKQRLAEERSRREIIDPDSVELSRKEWVQQGGDAVHRMNDDDEDVAFDGTRKGGNESIDMLLDQISAQFATARCSRVQVQEFITMLYDVSSRSPVLSVCSFRFLLKDIHMKLMKRRSLNSFDNFILFVVPQIFPITDYRHEVTTPWYILLSSLIAQVQLDTFQQVRQGLLWAALLQSALVQSHKFSSEPLTLALNVISLQLPENKLVSLKSHRALAPFPLHSRCPDPILKSNTTESSQILSYFDDSCGSEASLLDAANAILREAAAAWGDSPSFSSLLLPAVAQLASLLPSSSACQKTFEFVTQQAENSKLHRTPLAMRIFRPRPLRQFDPLLGGEEELSEIQQRRILKKEIREDRKRIVRHVQAEASVERRGREKQMAADEERRTAKFHQVMGELQQQQHIMKSVDRSMEKARSKKRGKITGATSKDGEEK